MAVLPLSVLALLSTAPLFSNALTTATYSLASTYSGSSFFDDWTYYGKYDNTTDGDVTFVNETVADGTPQLTYINSAGNAIIKVDNTSTVDYNYKRNSVKITSDFYVDIGSVWVLDAVHLPYGCSVWPSFWSTGDDWPNGGEIDTFEGVNQVQHNQMTLHTKSGCSQASSVTQTGTTNSTDCDEAVNDNAGCAVTDTNTDSYGSAFAAAGGGVWVTEMAAAGINIWFFTRSSVPSSLSNSSSTIDTSAFGTPTATWPKSSCDIDTYFTAQRLVLDITLCGSWAGTASVLEETCPALTGTATCYTTYVLDGSNYNNAYFEIKSLKVYGSTSTTSTSSTTSAAVAVSPSSIARWTGAVVLSMAFVALF